MMIEDEVGIIIGASAIICFAPQVGRSLVASDVLKAACPLPRCECLRSVGGGLSGCGVWRKRFPLCIRVQ